MNFAMIPFYSASFFLGVASLLLLHSIGAKINNVNETLVENHAQSSKPLHEVATLGAATTGPLLEGVSGAINKGRHRHFDCYSANPKPGFLGPQTIAKHPRVKDQPGVFPAPLMGPASLTFTFSSQSKHCALTPVIVRPDGTAFHGLPLTPDDSSQTLAVSSPAQTGIYTLFVLGHQKNQSEAHAIVKVTTSTQTQQVNTFHLFPFDLSDNHSDEFSAEFIYTQIP